MGIEDRLGGMSERKRAALTLAHEYAMPNRVESWLAGGIPLVIGKREGYRIWDLDGRELLDLHLNGGTYNLGHRHPAVLAALREGLERLDIGNHHFPSEARAVLAEKLARLTPGDLHYSVFVASGSEANDLAIKTARQVTGRRRIVALESGYHGATGLSGAAGQDDSARYFCSDYPDEFTKVPFDDLAAIDAALAGGDAAAVLLETIPATAGFPLPSDDYLPGVKALCEKHGALYLADEVQTGLGRTGCMWGVQAWDVEPDVLITGKGLSGGLYPIAAVVLTRRVGRWLQDKGWAHVSTFGGSELGCHVASTVLDLCSSEDALANARAISDYLACGLEDLRARRPLLVEVRRKGLVMGLVTSHSAGGMLLSAALYRNGVWAMFAGFDPSVLQFKPGLLVDRPYCDELLQRLDAALQELEAEIA
jgi:acetylornithine/succinyldiaminopimelate/putrescine aminotransferase